MGNSMGTIIQNIGNIVVSDRNSRSFSDIQTGLALSKWLPIGLKFCMYLTFNILEIFIPLKMFTIAKAAT
jgi:hypothetical protein